MSGKLSWIMFKTLNFKGLFKKEMVNKMFNKIGSKLKKIMKARKP